MMFIQGTDRSQTHLFPISIEESIAKDNEVRIIDLFVSGFDLAKKGFDTQFVDNGRPAYHPADLLRLFIYGLSRPEIDLQKIKKQKQFD